ncbi:MAG: GNAT family acetyltransferase [Fusobacterium sp.]|nr:GNAT family acetyltransferase [Fusobacterium sp.]
MERKFNLENENLYELLNNLKTADYMKLRKKAKTEDEKIFYTRLEEMILRLRQEKAIDEGVF